jgi:hypothetical protein
MGVAEGPVPHLERLTRHGTAQLWHMRAGASPGGAGGTSHTSNSQWIYRNALNGR